MVSAVLYYIIEKTIRTPYETILNITFETPLKQYK